MDLTGAPLGKFRRSLENYAALSVPNSPFGNLVVRLARCSRMPTNLTCRTRPEFKLPTGIVTLAKGEAQTYRRHPKQTVGNPGRVPSARDARVRTLTNNCRHPP